MTAAGLQWIVRTRADPDLMNSSDRVKMLAKQKARAVSVSLSEQKPHETAAKIVLRKIMPMKSTCQIVTTLLAGAVLAGLSPQPDLHAASLPPHAWLFGAWAGGIFPAPDQMSPAECQARATFLVTQDVVIHSTLTHPNAIQNMIVSVRGTPGGTIFMLAPSDEKPEQIGGVPVDLGFGCPTDNVLRVVRVGPNEIRFPDCKGFPSTLVRCGAPG